MQDYLVFQLYAPLVSWGTQAVGQERPSEDHPGRSAILGLLAAGLGIDRQDDAQHAALSKACKLGVKQYSPGLALRDFHTIQVPPANKKSRHLYTRRDELREPKLGTILSFRSYLQSSFNLAAVVSNHSDYPCKKLMDALLEPHFQLYLGRKSCPPALPLNPQVIHAPSLKAAFDACELPEIFQPPKNSTEHKPRYFWELGIGAAGVKENYRVRRYDQPISRQRWQFTSRDEFVSLGE